MTLKKVYTSLDRETAFYYYFQLGEKRTLNKVKKKTDIPLIVLMEWEKEDNWKKRIGDQEDIINISENKKRSSTLAELSAASVFSLYLGIVNSKDSTNNERMKAAEKLEKLSDKAAGLKDFRKVAVKLVGIEDLKQKLKDAGFPVREDIE